MTERNIINKAGVLLKLTFNLVDYNIIIFATKSDLKTIRTARYPPALYSTEIEIPDVDELIDIKISPTRCESSDDKTVWRFKVSDFYRHKSHAIPLPIVFHPGRQLLTFRIYCGIHLTDTFSLNIGKYQHRRTMSEPSPAGVLLKINIYLMDNNIIIVATISDLNTIRTARYPPTLYSTEIGIPDVDELIDIKISPTRCEGSDDETVWCFKVSDFYRHKSHAIPLPIVFHHGRQLVTFRIYCGIYLTDTFSLNIGKYQHRRSWSEPSPADVAITLYHDDTSTLSEVFYTKLSCTGKYQHRRTMSEPSPADVAKALYHDDTSTFSEIFDTTWSRTDFTEGPESAPSSKDEDRHHIKNYVLAGNMNQSLRKNLIDIGGGYIASSQRDVTEATERKEVKQEKIAEQTKDHFQSTGSGSSTAVSSGGKLQRLIEEKLSDPVTQAKSVGQNGGSIDLQGCRVDVPPRAYDATTRVKVSVTPFISTIPPGWLPISPELECTSELSFKGFVTITLPAHILPEENGAITIIAKKDAESAWEKLNTKNTIVLENRRVRFKVSHFTIFGAIIRFFQIWKTFLSHSLYFNSETSALCAVTCFDSETVIETCHAIVLRLGFSEAPHPPSKIALSSGNKMSYKYECKTPQRCQVDPGGRIEFTPQSFAGVRYHVDSYSIDPRPEVPQIKIRFLFSTPQKPNGESVITILWNNDGQARPVEPLVGHQREDAVAPVQAPNIQPSTREFIDGELNKDGNYKFDHNRSKGMVLIINNEFRGQGQAERTGSLVDVQKFRNLCADLLLDVSTKNNLTADQMLGACREFSTDAQNVNLLILVIMSHGGKRDGSEFFSGEDGNTVSSDEVISIFSSINSPHLEGIPKVFVFQACRGDEAERGLEEPLVERDAGPGNRRNQGRSDMLFVYPSQHGYAAFRHRINGSWLINILVQVFREHAHDRHVVDMLTMVNREISRIESEGGDIQRSNYLSFFRHDLYLFPGWPS